MKPTAEPIATAIGSVEITPAGPADIDDVLDILNEAARWLASCGINQWRVDGFPRGLIADGISRGEVYVARRDDRAVGTFTLQRSDELFWPGAAEEAGYIHRIAVRRDARGLGVELLKFAERVTTATGCKLLRLDVFRETQHFVVITSGPDSCASPTSRSMVATTRLFRDRPAASSRVSTRNPCTDSTLAASAALTVCFFFRPTC
jgi:GNAT superfamily N-acetyltransferase